MSSYNVPAPPGGALVLLGERVASASAQLVFAGLISSLYDEYLFEFVNISPSAAAGLQMQLSNDGGATFDATATSYITSHIAWSSSGSAVGGGTQGAFALFPLWGRLMVVGTSFNLSGWLRMYAPGSALWKQFIASWVGPDSATAGAQRLDGTYVYNQVTAYNAVRFLTNTGVIQSGKIRMYGVVPVGTSFATALPGTDGWTPSSETWTYLAADAPTFTFTVASDVTAKYSPGMRVRLTQTTSKYFIVTAVSAFTGGFTTITVYGGTDYTLANAAITAGWFSTDKAPFGFPLDPAKWTVSLVDTIDRTQAPATAGTVYNLGSLSLSIPIGVWNLSWSASVYADCGASVTYLTAAAAVSTTIGSFSDAELKQDWFLFATSMADVRHRFGLGKSKVIALAAKTTYYFVASASESAGNPANLRAYGSGVSPTIIRAVCAYL